MNSPLLTRGGQQIIAPDWFVENYPPFAIDGELWTKRADFEEISSIVRRKNPDERWHKITHQIFEVPNQDGGLLDRLKVLRNYLKNQANTPIKIIKQYPIAHQNQVKKFLRDIVHKDGEGVVVRNPATAYQTGRLSSALKVKKYLDTECVIEKILPGKGKYVGKMGSLLCKTKGGAMVKIGSGFTDVQRKNPPAIGTSVTFKYYGLTKKGKFKYPVFLRIRTQRDLCINRYDWQNPIFAQLVISLNLVLAGLRLGLKNLQVSEKWVSDDYSYLYKGLSINILKLQALFLTKKINMDNTQQARQNSIDSQIRPWGGLNYIANNALRDIPREVFVPEAYKNLAFADIEIPLNKQAKMFSPKIEGRLLNALNIKSHETVLEIGTGSGYLTAVVAKLCKSITSVEIDEALSNGAKEKLNELNINNAQLTAGDASQGWQSNDFFDVVIVGSAVPEITGRYFHLLNVGGRIFVVEGKGNAMTAKLITRISENEWETEALFETHLSTMQGLEAIKSFEF